MLALPVRASRRAQALAGRSLADAEHDVAGLLAGLDAPKGFARKLVAEMRLYPDGSRVLKLSTKCAPQAGFQVAAETRAFLSERGVDLSGEQQTKTRRRLSSSRRACSPMKAEAIGHLELLDIPGRRGRIEAFGRGRVDIERKRQ